MRRLAPVALLCGLMAFHAQAAVITWVSPAIGVPTLVPSVPGIPAGTTMTVTDTSPAPGYFPTTISGTGMTSGPHTWPNTMNAYGNVNPVNDATLTITFNQEIDADLFAVAIHGMNFDTNGGNLVNIRAATTLGGTPAVMGSDFSLIAGYKDMPAGQVDFAYTTDGADAALTLNAGDTNNSLLADISGHNHQMEFLSVITDGTSINDTHWVRFGFFGQPAAVPEPSSFLFLGLIATGICGVRLRRRFWGANETAEAE